MIKLRALLLESSPVQYSTSSGLRLLCAFTFSLLCDFGLRLFSIDAEVPVCFFSMRHPPYVHVLIPAISWWPTLGISGLLRQTGQRDRCGFCGIHVVGCTYRWTLLSTYGQSANGGQKFFNRIPVIIFTFLKTTEGLDICFKWFVILPQRIKLKKMYLQKNIHHLKKLE